MRKSYKASVAVAALLALSACGIFKGGKKSTPVLGNRVPILVSEDDAKPDPSLADVQVLLPDPTANTEWTQPGALPIERDCCRHCRKPLPEGRRVFCCIECKRWHHGERAKQAHEEERRAYQKAWYAARSARLPEQVCEGCGRSYRPKRPGQRFCSVDCANHVYANPANL